MIPPQPAPAIAMTNRITEPTENTQVLSTTHCPFCYSLVQDKLTYGEVRKRNKVE